MLTNKNSVCYVILERMLDDYVSYHYLILDITLRCKNF